MVFKIKHVPYLSQRKNKKKKFISCYRTSMSMLIEFCLNYIGTTKAVLGCSHEISLPEFLDKELTSSETRIWIKKNVSRFGSWMLKFRPATIAVVQEMIFNKLMNKIGFECRFKQIHADDFVNWFILQSFPVVLHGNFKSVSRVGGHICCMVGVADNEQYIVHDPFGNALSNYAEKTGMDRIYNRRFFLKRGNKIWFQSVIFNEDI